jgi:hypothetical protein
MKRRIDRSCFNGSRRPQASGAAERSVTAPAPSTLLPWYEPANRGEDILHHKTMCRGADAAHRIFDEDQLIALIVGGTCGGFDTEIRGDSTQDDRTDSSPA